MTADHRTSMSDPMSSQPADTAPTATAWTEMTDDDRRAAVRTVMPDATDEQFDELLREADDQDNPLRFAAEVNDVGWWYAHGMCGGCGTSDCHIGPCGNVGWPGHCDRYEAAS